MYQTNKGTVPCMVQVRRMLPVRDGPFDIQGGWLGFFLATSYFFSLLAKQVIFSKVNRNKFFYFFEKKYIKIRKM